MSCTESDRAIHIYIQGLDSGGLLNPKAFAQMCIQAIDEYKCNAKRALDVMCSVGRLSFELANVFDEVNTALSSHFVSSRGY